MTFCIFLAWICAIVLLSLDRVQLQSLVQPSRGCVITLALLSHLVTSVSTVGNSSFLCTAVRTMLIAQWWHTLEAQLWWQTYRKSYVACHMMPLPVSLSDIWRSFSAVVNLSKSNILVGMWELRYVIWTFIWIIVTCRDDAITTI